MSSHSEDNGDGVFWLSRAQASIQAYLRPGVWIPGARTPHQYRERWSFDGESPDQVFTELIKALESVRHKERLQVKEINNDDMFIQAISYTPRCSWLDILEIQLDTTLLQPVTAVNIRGFSSGVFPVWIPLSFVWNCLFCWVPFGDVGMNQRRIRAIREAMNLRPNVELKGRPC